MAEPKYNVKMSQRILGDIAQNYTTSKEASQGISNILSLQESILKDLQTLYFGKLKKDS